MKQEKTEEKIEVKEVIKPAEIKVEEVKVEEKKVEEVKIA